MAEPLYHAAKPLAWDEDPSGAVLPSSIPTAAEVERIVAKLPMPYSLMIEFAAGTGMRRGEMLGLLWPSVDLDRGVVMVNRGMSYALGKKQMFEPKTKAGLRAIPLAPDLLDKLKAYRETTIARDGSGGLVFPNPLTGMPMSPNAISLAFKVAGVKLKLHSLRHYFVSHALADGASLAQISKLAGHSSISVTARVYAHCLPESDWRPSGRRAAV